MIEAQIHNVLRNLEKHHMKGYYIEDKNQLFSLLESLIEPKSTIGCGDSVTLEQLGVFDYIRTKDFEFYDKYKKGYTKEEKRELYLKNFRADTFITGTNAITLTGELFNIDGNGSRVAPMIYGPNQVIVVVGINKIVQDVEAAIMRTRQIAAPLDAKRLNKDTPCTKINRCIDCEHPQRICNDFVLIAGQFIKERIKVIIINEKLGY